MSDLNDADLEVLSKNLSSGKLDPSTLSAEKRANLKTQLTAYQARKTGQPAALPKNTAGQTIYPQPKIGDAPHPAGADPVPDAARGALAGFRGQETPPGANLPERVGHFVGKEGPAMLGMGAMALLAPEAALPVGVTAAGNILPGVARAALGAAGGAGWQTAYQELFGKPTKPLDSTDAARLVGAKALEGAAAEVGGKLTEGGLRVLRQASLSQLEKLTNLPHSYVQRALARASTALPAMGESLASAEQAAMRHVQGVQDALEGHMRSAGAAVEGALERLHVKTGGQKIADTKPLADAMRQIIDEKYRASDPTMQELAKTDLQRIAKVLRTMDATVTDTAPDAGKAARKAAGVVEPGKGAFKQVTRPLKSIRDLVQIRRELDNMVGYTPAGLPKMESDMGAKLAKTLADEYRGLISKVADDQGDKSLLLANSNYTNLSRNYEQWQPIMTTKTEGEPHLLARMKAVDRLMSHGGEGAAMFDNLKTSFPKSAPHVDGLADSLVRRSFIKAQEAPADNFLRNVVKAVAPNKYNPAYAVRQAGKSVAGAGAAGRAGTYLSAEALNALLAHIKPEDRKK